MRARAEAKHIARSRPWCCGPWLVMLVVVLTALMGGCSKETPGTSSDPSDGDAARADVRTVRFWQPFGGDVGKAMHEIVAEFNRTHPKIHVEVSFAANNLSASQKLFLAIAGGEAPDVTMVDGQQLAEWAARGALTDITEQVGRAGISGDDFFLPRWQESVFRNRVYALPWGADPNFAFCWNKKAFREAGLDPERPPRTIAELDEYNQKLTKFDANGRLVQIGLSPWPFGEDNAMFTWGYAFGGDFYQPSADGVSPGRVMVNDPHNVAALRWLQSFGNKYDVRKLSAFQSSFVGLANDPFRLGRQTMCLLHVLQVQDIKRYAPTLEYGIGLIPAPPGGEYPNAWIGGWSMAIPRGAVASDEAFEFMRWMCTSPEGTMKLGTGMCQFPAYRKSPYYQSIQGNRDLEAFYEVLKGARHVRTLMPAQGYLMDLLRRGADEVLYGGRDPQAVLDGITIKAQKRLEYVMTRANDRTDKGAEGEEAKEGAAHE